jgi:hypothetical protein
MAYSEAKGRSVMLQFTLLTLVEQRNHTYMCVEYCALQRDHTRQGSTKHYKVIVWQKSDDYLSILIISFLKHLKYRLYEERTPSLKTAKIKFNRCGRMQNS